MKIGIDFDDTLCPFVKIACDICNTEKGTNYAPKDIICWGFGGNDAIKDVSDFYSDERVYLSQEVPEASKVFVRKLMKNNDVYIISAVEGKFMSFRAKQILEAFPELPASHIIMGVAKNLVQFDIILDDGPHNILKSCATYPVLLRKPWNKDLSGVLSVNTLNDFLLIVDQIKKSMIEGKQLDNRPRPTILALVGPTGAKKNMIAKELEKEQLAIRVSSIQGDEVLPMEETAAETIYGRKRFFYKRSDIEKALKNQNVVCTVDMAGAMQLKSTYPTILIFCKQSREKMFLEIVCKKNLFPEEKAIRCTSMEQELKNESLCDISVRTDCVSDAIEKIKKLLF